jgi:hypothetical protein
MKQAKNNTVDLLLRSLARGRESSSQNKFASGNGNETLSEHLDADELNSYAEGVLPAAARARYTEHLADCAACRGIVVGLTQASGAVTHYEVSELKSRLGFFEKLGVLFSPAVLRFAIPALVLTVAIGITLLALRQPPRPEMTARNEPVDSTSAAAPLKQTEVPAGQSSNQAPTAAQRGSNLPANPDLSKETDSLKNEKAFAGEGAGIAANKRAPSEPVAKDEDRPGAVAGQSELRPSYAPEPKAAAPPPAKPSSSDAGAFAIAKEQPVNREEQGRQRDDITRSQPSGEHGPNRSAVPRTGGLATQRADELTVRRGGPSTQDKKNKGTEVESRSVSGRRFIREGDAWVDTAYETPRATVKVVRGSEQFRALVADEPGLGTIAQQLDGVIIVVWKNRAYRNQ